MSGVWSDCRRAAYRARRAAHLSRVEAAARALLDRGEPPTVRRVTAAVGGGKGPVERSLRELRRAGRLPAPPGDLPARVETAARALLDRGELPTVARVRAVVGASCARVNAALAALLRRGALDPDRYDDLVYQSRSRAYARRRWVARRGGEATATATAGG